MTTARVIDELWRPARVPARRALRRCRELLGDDPRYLPIVLRCTPEGTERRLTSDTDLVIEGYPRSGNTFAVFALRRAAARAGRAIVVKSHVHSPSQVKLAVRRGLPTVLVVRNPVDAVASTVIAAPHVRVAAALREYAHHHRELLPLGDGYLVASFEQVTSAFDTVTKEVNDRFDLDLPIFEHTDAEVRAVFRAIEIHHARVHPNLPPERVVPRPSRSRLGEKARLVTEIHASNNAARLRDAVDVYRELAERSTR